MGNQIWNEFEEYGQSGFMMFFSREHLGMWAGIAGFLFVLSPFFAPESFGLFGLIALVLFLLSKAV